MPAAADPGPGSCCRRSGGTDSGWKSSSIQGMRLGGPGPANSSGFRRINSCRFSRRVVGNKVGVTWRVPRNERGGINEEAMRKKAGSSLRTKACEATDERSTGGGSRCEPAATRTRTRPLKRCVSHKALKRCVSHTRPSSAACVTQDPQALCVTQRHTRTSSTVCHTRLLMRCVSGTQKYRVECASAVVSHDWRGEPEAQIGPRNLRRGKAVGAELGRLGAVGQT